MKLKMGPGLHDISLHARDGELLVGRDTEGKFVNKLNLMNASFEMGASRFPILHLDIELIGYEIELDAIEDDVVAFLSRKGITRIDGRREGADIHTDA